MTANEQELRNRVRHLKETIDTLNALNGNYKQIVTVKDERIKELEEVNARLKELLRNDYEGV